MKIIPLEEKHWLQVKFIYEEGIATGNATFETEAPSWEKWNASHLSFARIVAMENDEVLGWAALSKVSDRCVYAGVAEVSVYVKGNSRGKGVGSALLAALISESESNNLWTLTAGIFPENNSSIHLHEKFGFRLMGRREHIGQMNGVWRDTLQFERRSKVVGVD
ncbi:MAG: GNAT family N-acetyltransferase [Chitinophagales bacterium]